MKATSVLIFPACFITVVTAAPIIFFYSAAPTYVRDAVTVLSAKISYSYGLTECVADKEGNDWILICSPEDKDTRLEFIVEPESNAPYDFSTPFYLIANNAAAKQAASMEANESILSYLQINVEGN